MTEKTQSTGRGAILYDATLLDHADEALFVPPADAPAPEGGRGGARVIRHGDGEWVLRHYRRGGLPGRFVHDRYLWTGLEATRPWREWRLLDSLYKEGLPVPQPLAARVLRAGLFYRGDLLTRRIPKARSLAVLLSGPRRLPWDVVGRTLRRFHEAGVWHADLNAHNILLDESGGVHLIDFDRGERRTPQAGWKQANLARLRRSFDKLTGGFDVHAWSVLLDAYRCGG